MLQKIDADTNGTISELELVAAVRKYPEVAALMLPGCAAAAGKAMTEEDTFDAVDDIFERMAGGKQRVTLTEFAVHCKRMQSEQSSNDTKLAEVYELIDADKNGAVSKLELFDAVERNPDVAQVILRGANFGGRVMSDEAAFDAVKRVFDAVARGKKRFDFADFRKHFGAKKSSSVDVALPLAQTDRSSKRVLIIGPGFGRGLNPQQGALVDAAGYSIVHWCWQGLPNPEQPHFPVEPYLHIIQQAIQEVQPSVVVCAAKGGAYMASLWRTGLWTGPSVLINAHPACQRLPEGVPIVLCHGSNDEVFPTPRAKLEELIATGSANRSFLYYTGNSGQLPTGQFSRVGDRHNMESILSHDCLPRLLDAAMSSEGPELHFMRTWRERVTPQRLEAEVQLGYRPDLLRRRWVSPGHSGRDNRKLFEVPAESEEFQHVVAVFKAQPKELPAYVLSPAATWDIVQVKKVERIENGALHDGCTGPYYASVERSVRDQGVEFEPGVHTNWAFHGADEKAIESIVSNCVAGFQPLASGTRGASLWGSGTYFARDAKYVADGGFCGRPAADGTRRMLMCLLTTGIPCLGDPKHHGVLPLRRKPHQYHCGVDSLSSPEIFITQQSGAAHAAYLITFA